MKCYFYRLKLFKLVSPHTLHLVTATVALGLIVTHVYLIIVKMAHPSSHLCNNAYLLVARDDMLLLNASLSISSGWLINSWGSVFVCAML